MSALVQAVRLPLINSSALSLLTFKSPHIAAKGFGASSISSSKTLRSSVLRHCTGHVKARAASAGWQSWPATRSQGHRRHEPLAESTPHWQLRVLVWCCV